MFTLADKGLLDRAARLLLEHAQQIENAHGRPAWVGEEARKQKLVFDRLQRDARDLRSLAKRMAAHFGTAPAPRQARGVDLVGAREKLDALKQEGATILRNEPTEPSISEQREMGVLGGHGADQVELGIAHG